MKKVKALLIATGEKAGMEAMVTYRPLSLLHIVDKPIIHHILEQLYRLGIRECHIILHHLPHLVRNEVGDGERFGIKIHYHLTKSAKEPFRAILPLIDSFDQENILLASESTLPSFPHQRVEIPLKQPLLIVSSAKKWTEWGYFPIESLRSLPLESGYEELPNRLRKGWKPLYSTLLFSIDSYRSLKQSNIKGIKNLDKLSLPTATKEVKKGLFIAKGATLHKKTILHPPVFIGENCRIEEGVEIGPNVVVERNCLLDKNSTICDTLICKNSYIGESLNISQSLVDKNLLVNTCLESEISISEEFILGRTTTPPIKKNLFHLLERIAAITLLILLLPLILLLLPFSRLARKIVVAIPVDNPTSPPWKTFELLSWRRKKGGKYRCFHKIVTAIPQLLNIAKGELHFVGLPARSAEEIDKLPATWRNLYLKSRVGIANLADIERPIDDTSDHIFTCEMYQTINKSLLFKLQLIARWLFLP